MGNNLIASSKLQFYPTDVKETLKLLKYTTYMDISYFKKETLKTQILGEALYKQLYTKVLDNEYKGFVDALYDYCIDNDKYDIIDDFIECKIYGTQDDTKEYVIADFFAGEGKWLEKFKTFLKYTNKPNIRLIANELEENRYNVINESGIVDEVYLGSFEGLKFPKRSVSLMLFNPPYNDDIRQRNCRKYLQMILDRELIYKNNDEYHRETGHIMMVIREDDFIDSMDIIVKNFDIYSCYKVNENEFSKWKQWVIIAELRYRPLEDTNQYDIRSIQELIIKFKDVIAGGKPYTRTYNILMRGVDYKQLKDNFKYVIAKDEVRVGGKDGILKWIKDITELKDMSLEKLTVPKPLKQGEIANIISSGYINGEISLPDGTVKHIVIGGTKNMTKTEKRIEKDEQGNKYEVTEELRYTQPYLNVLCNKDGKMQIIELGGERD